MLLNWILALLALTAVASLLWWKLRRPGRSVPTPFADFPTRIVDVDGWSIRYHQAGRGPHLLLIHGIGANLFCWRFLTPILETHFTVTALDLPGFGQSSKPADARYGLEDQAERLDAFCARLGIDEAFVVGNSMGGNIALWFALTRPKRVRGLAVIAPATSPSLVPMPLSRWLWLSGPVAKVLTREAMRWAHGRTVSRRELVDADRIEETFRTYGGNAEAVRSFMLATEAIRDPKLGARLGELEIPTLILWGSRDRLVSRRVIDELESALGATESHVHMGGGHHLQEDEPEWVGEKLLSFFLPKQD